MIDKKLFILGLLFFSFLYVACPVYAQDDPDLDLLDLPSALADQLGITVFSAGLILTALLLFPFNLCLLLWSKGGTITIIINFVFLGFFTSIGWIPNWTVILVALIIAGLYATKLKDVF